MLRVGPVTFRILEDEVADAEPSAKPPAGKPAGPPKPPAEGGRQAKARISLPAEVNAALERFWQAQESAPCDEQVAFFAREARCEQETIRRWFKNRAKRAKAQLKRAQLAATATAHAAAHPPPLPPAAPCVRFADDEARPSMLDNEIRSAVTAGRAELAGALAKVREIRMGNGCDEEAKAAAKRELAALDARAATLLPLGLAPPLAPLLAPPPAPPLGAAPPLSLIHI